MKKLITLILFVALLFGTPNLVSADISPANFWKQVGNYLTPWKATLGVQAPTLNVTGTATTSKLCFSNGSCQTVAGGGGGSDWATTSTDYWKTQRNFFSTTSVDYWETTQPARGGGSSWATTSTDYWLTQQSIPVLTDENNFSVGTTSFVNGYFSGNLRVDGLLYAPVELTAGTTTQDKMIVGNQLSTSPLNTTLSIVAGELIMEQINTDSLYFDMVDELHTRIFDQGNTLEGAGCVVMKVVAGTSNVAPTTNQGDCATNGGFEIGTIDWQTVTDIVIGSSGEYGHWTVSLTETGFENLAWVPPVLPTAKVQIWNDEGYANGDLTMLGKLTVSEGYSSGAYTGGTFTSGLEMYDDGGEVLFNLFDATNLTFINDKDGEAEVEMINLTKTSAEIKVPFYANSTAEFSDLAIFNGNIGNGTGTTTFDGTMKVPQSDNGCTASEAGAIMFDGSNFQGCNGSAWVQLDNAI